MPDPKNPNNWGKVAVIINEVMQRGNEETHKHVQKKVLEIGGQIVEVTYKLVNGEIRISDAWVK